VKGALRVSRDPGGGGVARAAHLSMLVAAVAHAAVRLVATPRFAAFAP